MTLNPIHHFIDYQKVANKLTIDLLEEIQSSIRGKLIIEFNVLKESIQLTLKGIETVTSREIASYDAITGMLIALDKKLETIDEYVHRNIETSLNITSSLKSTKYPDFSIIQEWYLDFFIFTLSRMTNISEEKIRIQQLQIIKEYQWKNGKDKALKFLSFEDRAREGLKLIEITVKHFNLANCIHGTLISSYHLYLSLIYRRNPIEFPELEYIGDHLGKYFHCQQKVIDPIIHLDIINVIDELENFLKDDLYSISGRGTDGSSSTNSSE